MAEAHGRREADLRLLEALTPSERAENGVPGEDLRRRRSRARQRAVDALADLLLAGDQPVSPLGPEWSTDIDLHVRRLPEPGVLQARGWLPLDGLLRRIGSPSAGRWAVTEEREVIGAVDLHVGAPTGGPLDRIVRRCVRAAQVTVREVMELQALARTDDLSGAPARVLRAAACAEAALGGAELSAWRAGDERSRPPVRVRRGPGEWMRAQVRRTREALRPRVVVALSGVDGAGKSSVSARLHDQLVAAGVPTGTVWARPGNDLRVLTRLAEVVKRTLRQETRPGVELIATGDRPARAQSGVVNLGWSVLVTGAFLVDVWKQHLRARGVVIWDRHVLDALATLDFAYAGPGLGMVRAVVERALPPSTLNFYFDVPVEVAAVRKPGDLLGTALALAGQTDSYRRQLASRPDVRVLDATAPLDELVDEVLRSVVGLGELPAGRSGVSAARRGRSRPAWCPPCPAPAGSGSRRTC